MFALIFRKMETEHQVLPIVISSVDDIIPEISVGNISVEKGSRTILTMHDISATDKDTDLDRIIFRVVQEPQFGEIQFKLRSYDKWLVTQVSFLLFLLNADN